MLCQLRSATTFGIDAVPVAIETNVASGMPRFTVVGLPDVSVRESRDRIHAAITNSGFDFPRGAITVNLAPADIRKEGAAFDLPIAASLLGASGVIGDGDRLRTTMVVGELALDGRVRAVRGVLPVAMRAHDECVENLLVPHENIKEAALVDGLSVYGVASLSDTVRYFNRARDGPAVFRATRTNRQSTTPIGEPDFSDVRGQAAAKRALEVAAAGGHNVLMIGTPGVGKTMLARRLPGILPPMSRSEALETTKIHSVGGRLNGTSLILRRPFRAPHHTISMSGLCGGGASPRPGEISLAHNGVLFMDELPEFRRPVLEVLRQPLEEGRITITRAAGTVDFPSRFMLVASMNSCPCGYLGDALKDCVCSAHMVHRYHSRISGPLLDRIDIHLFVSRVGPGDLTSRARTLGSTEMRSRVAAARALQDRRPGSETSNRSNGTMPARSVRRWCKLDPDAAGLLRDAISRLRLSARAYHRVLRVARTIADLESHDGDIAASHVAEAIQYRSLDRADVFGS